MRSHDLTGWGIPAENCALCQKVFDQGSTFWFASKAGYIIIRSFLGIFWGGSSAVEHSAFNRLVVGSIPTRPTNIKPQPCWGFFLDVRGQLSRVISSPVHLQSVHGCSHRVRKLLKARSNPCLNTSGYPVFRSGFQIAI